MVWTLALALHFFQEEAANVPAPAVTSTSAIGEMIHNSGPVAFTVLVLLLLASIFSWTIMLSKWSSFKRAQQQGQRFVRAFRKSSRLSEVA
ncbi:MAG TPA: flagellar motor protein MotA, partial [Edaphobacter sp.]